MHLPFLFAADAGIMRAFRFQESFMKSVFFVVLLCCQSAAVFAADKISLVLDWFVNPVHS